MSLDISDAQLYEELRAFYPQLGPVVDTTRELYKKMLTRAVQAGTSPSPSLSTLNRSSVEQDTTSGLTVEEDAALTRALDILEQEESDTEPEIDDVDESGETIPDYRSFSTMHLSRSSASALQQNETLRGGIEDQCGNSFFLKAFFGGLVIVLASVAALYVLRESYDV